MPDYDGKLEDLKKQLTDVSTKLKRPSTGPLAALILGSIATGGAIGLLIRLYAGDPAVADFHRWLGTFFG
jgi:hypothetical protein